MKGDRAAVLNRPDAVLITEDIAKKYFGNEDPLGKILRKDNNKDVTITGVLANIPSNSHLQFDCILPMSSIAQTNENIKNQVWDNFDFYAYVQLDKTFDPSPANIAKFNKQMDDIYKTHVSEKVLKVNFWLQPLTAIHLHSNYQVDVPGHGNVQYVNIFFVVALFILAVACINFMNLATARSARRAKEVGLRKVVGAGRKQLIGQFLGESMLISFISLLIAVGLVWLLLPAFNDLAGKKTFYPFIRQKNYYHPCGHCVGNWTRVRKLPCLISFRFSTRKSVEREYKNNGRQPDLPQWTCRCPVCCFDSTTGRYCHCLPAARLYKKYEPGL
jgi:ABC-type antimicrobial peptide transport system permease subunit